MRQPLYRGFATGGTAFKDLVETPLPAFICPSDKEYNKPGRVHQNRDFNDGVGVVAGGIPTPVWPGLSTYIGVSGHRDVVQVNTNTGIFFGNSAISMADITDGTSNTVNLIESVDTGIKWLEPRDLNYADLKKGAYHSNRVPRCGTPTRCVCCSWTEAFS